MAQYGTRIKRHCGRMELSSLQIEMTRGPQTKTNIHQPIFKPSSKNHQKPSSVHTLVLCFHMFPKTLPATNPAMAIPSCIGAIRDGSAQGSHIPRGGGPAKLLQGLLHLAMKLLPSQ